MDKIWRYFVIWPWASCEAGHERIQLSYVILPSHRTGKSWSHHILQVGWLHDVSGSCNIPRGHMLLALLWTHRSVSLWCFLYGQVRVLICDINIQVEFYHSHTSAVLFHATTFEICYTMHHGSSEQERWSLKSLTKTKYVALNIQNIQSCVISNHMLALLAHAAVKITK